MGPTTKFWTHYFLPLPVFLKLQGLQRINASPSMPEEIKGGTSSLPPGLRSFPPTCCWSKYICPGQGSWLE